MDEIPADSILGRSTRDRVSPTGERIQKSDFDVDDLVKPGKSEKYPQARKRAAQKPRTQSLMTVLSKQLEKEHLKYQQEQQEQQRAIEWANEHQPKTLLKTKETTPRWQETPSTAKVSADLEYAYVTQKGDAIFTKECPASLSSEDLFSVVNRNPHPQAYAKSINKLEYKGWDYIGCGYPSDMVVFARPKRRQWFKQILGGGILAVVVAAILLEIDERWTGTTRRADWEAARELRRLEQGSETKPE